MNKTHRIRATEVTIEGNLRDLRRVARATKVPRLISKNELAERWGVSVKTVTRRMAQGLPFHKMGRQVRISEEDANNFLAALRKVR